jgi:hypothetical protein
LDVFGSAVTTGDVNSDGLGDLVVGALGRVQAFVFMGGPKGADADGDGCVNDAELGTNSSFGGRRNPKLFWDFFDVPAPPSYTRNQAINIADIAAVIARFGAARAGGPPDKPTALAEAQSAPPLPPVYHAAYDRTVAGALTGPPDGAISVQDIGRAVAQFGHGCIAPP